MKPTVYIETTMISYRIARPSRDLIIAAHQQITHDWWEMALPQFDAFISPIVLEEISRGYPDAAKLRMDSIASFQLLEVLSEVRKLADAYFAAIEILKKRGQIHMTNQLKAPPAKLISRYAKRMIIENSIQDGIDFFHMDALPSAVAMKVNLDLQLTLMGSSLYHLLGQDVGRGYEVAKSRHIFRDLVDTPSVLILDLIQNEAYIESRSAFSCGGFKMTQITLRGLDALAEDQIRKRARETGKSLNQVVLDIVHQALGVGGQQKRPAGEELRFLAGGWTQAEAEEVMAGVVQCRQIDEELWT